MLVPQSAVGGGHHAVVHYFIPILASDDPEEQSDPTESSPEVGSSADALSALDGSEEENPSESVREDKQKHAGDDEKTFVHRNHDGEHQHFEGGVLAGDGEKA